MKCSVTIRNELVEITEPGDIFASYLPTGLKYIDINIRNTVPELLNKLVQGDLSLLSSVPEVVNIFDFCGIDYSSDSFTLNNISINLENKETEITLTYKEPTMANSKSLTTLARFKDCEIVMDRALETPGLLYRLPSSGEAIQFKQRCNTWRKRLREQVEEGPGGEFLPVGETAYDILVIRQVHEDGTSSREGRCIRFDHHVNTPGEFLLPSGEVEKIDLEE